jgi:Domain of unknown function (DUF4787)
MVAPTHPSKTKKQSAAAVGPASQSSSSDYLLLAVKILLVLIILFLLPQFVTGGGDGTTSISEGQRRRKRSTLKLRKLRWDCQNSNDYDCALLIPQESLNCVNECMSPACYTQVYAHEPLEDGQVDIPRAKEFEACVQEELRVLRRQLQSEAAK